MYTENKPLIEADTHCHTNVSHHAYSSLEEMAAGAVRHGLKCIVITNHGPAMKDGAHIWHFGNMRTLPKYINGLRVLHGAEANIIDYEGNLDIDERYQNELDWVIASMHEPIIEPSSVENHTKGYLKIAQNPYVDVVGHSGSGSFIFDYEKVIPAIRDAGKLIEINNHSFEARLGATENCEKIALLCKKHNCPIVVNSDAHNSFVIADVGVAFAMLRRIDFPFELIINLTFERLAKWILNKRNRNII